jgi:hypothetical protein
MGKQRPIYVWLIFSLLCVVVGIFCDVTFNSTRPLEFWPKFVIFIGLITLVVTLVKWSLAIPTKPDPSTPAMKSILTACAILSSLFLIGFLVFTVCS